jgi:hypothetical protein
MSGMKLDFFNKLPYFAISVFAGWAILTGSCIRSANAQVFPLTVSSDNRRLVDQNNQTFLINGDVAGGLMVSLTKEKVEIYLENRRRKGMNAMLLDLLVTYWAGPANVYGDKPFTTPNDFSTPNDAYFDHIAWVVAKAEEKGILVVLTPCYLGFLCGEQGWCQQMVANGTAKCRAYGRYIGKRFSEFKNIMWMHGGDAEAGEAIEELRAIVEGIKEADRTSLHTAHCGRHHSALDCYDEPWLDVNTTYSDCDSAASETFEDYNRQRIMPFFFAEGTYEGEGASEECLRSQAYWSILGGSIGHFLGNNPLIFFGDGWEEAMESAGAQSMMHMGALFRSRAWSLLEPDYSHESILSGFGNPDNSNYVGAARTSDGKTIIAYMPAKRKLNVDLTRISGAQAKAWWFNPGTGVATLIGNFPAAGEMEFTPGASGDWVLVIDDADAGLPPPGSSDEPMPGEFELDQNYPNPFNSRTTLSYALAESAFVSLKVFDVSGAEITSLVEETQPAGYHSISFDATNLSSGIYFYQLRVDGQVFTKKMLLFK